MRDSENVSGTTILAANDAVNSGHNLNWAFPIAVTVTNKDGAAAGSGQIVMLTVDGGFPVSSVTNSQGVATFNDGNAGHTVSGVSSGALLTMWLSGGSGSAVTVDKTNGTTLGFTLARDTLTVREDNNSPVTNANLAAASQSGSIAGINALYTMSGTMLVGTEGDTLTIPTGTVYTPGAPVTAHDYRIAGTFHMGSNNVTVTGSWDATGGTFDGNNTVSFTSQDAETITVNKSSFKKRRVRRLQGIPARTSAIGRRPTTSLSPATSTSNASSNPHFSPVISNVTINPVYDKLAVVNWDTNIASTSGDPLRDGQRHPDSLRTLYVRLRVQYGACSDVAATHAGHGVLSASRFGRLLGNTGTGAVMSFHTMKKLSTAEEVATATGSAASSAAAAQAAVDASSAAAALDSALKPVSRTAAGGGGGGGRTRIACSTPLTISGLAATASGNTENVTWTTNGLGVALVQFGVDANDERSQYDLSSFLLNHTIESLGTPAEYRLQAHCQCHQSVRRRGHFSGVYVPERLRHSHRPAAPDLSLHAAAGQADPQTVAHTLKLLSDITQAMPLNQLQPALLAESATLTDIASRLPGPVLSGEPKVDVQGTTATIGLDDGRGEQFPRLVQRCHEVHGRNVRHDGGES